MMNRAFLLTAALFIGCGTAQHATGPGEETLTDEFPSKPWPGQRKPDKTGRCDPRHGPPLVIVKGGGCWVEVVAEPKDCETAHLSGTSYLVPYEGHCYYPDFMTAPKREPTSSLLHR
jgi:eukaryotic-like serine/threonine-protein kinase